MGRLLAQQQFSVRRQNTIGELTLRISYSLGDEVRMDLAVRRRRRTARCRRFPIRLSVEALGQLSWLVCAVTKVGRICQIVWRIVHRCFEG